jgi:hypothetical protein
MTRHLFGGALPDWTFGPTTVSGTDNLAQLTGGVTVTLWNAETGGTQYTDLLDASLAAADHATSSDGSDGRTVGTIGPFYGPPDVYVMWASATGGPRAMIVSSDVGTLLGPLVDTLNAQIAAHLAADNPHGTSFAELTDVSITAPTDGQVPVWDDDLDEYVPGDPAGLNPAQFVATAGGSEVRIPDGDITTQALRIRVPAGDRTSTGAPDTVEVQWNAGTDGAPNWRRVGWLNEYGEIRVQASSSSRVPMRVKQRDGTQSNNLQEWTDNGNNPLSWIGPTGQIRGINIMYAPITFSRAGTVATGIGAARVYNDTGSTLTITFVRASAGTAPTGQSLIVDVNIDGSTIFSTQANRPTIAAAANTSGKVTSMNTTSIATGQYFTVDVDQVGSGTAGADLTVAIGVY